MITTFGIIFFILSAIAFLRSFQAVAFLYIFSYLFQVTSVLNIGNTGFAPYLIAPILLMLKGYLCRRKKTHNRLGQNLKKISIIFIIFVGVQTLMATHLFEGMLVLADGGGMESNLSKGGIPLAFSNRNIFQWIYLILNMGGVYTIACCKKYLKPNFSEFTIRYCLYFVLIIGLWRYLTINFGGFFPTDFFFSNPSYNLQTLLQVIGNRYRFTSIFLEASFCGLFISTFSWNYILTTQKNKILVIAISAICLIMTLSSTGFLLAALGLCLYLLTKKDIKLFFLISFISIVGIFLLQDLTLNEQIYNVTFNKMNSESADARTGVMLYSIRNFFDSYGFGCGLGSAVGSNLLLSLLSQIGIIGTALFGGYLYCLFCVLKRENTSEIFFPVILVLLGQVIAIGYLSYPVLWMQIAISLSTRPNNLAENANEKHLRSRV